MPSIGTTCLVVVASWQPTHTQRAEAPRSQPIGIVTCMLLATQLISTIGRAFPRKGLDSNDDDPGPDPSVLPGGPGGPNDQRDPNSQLNGPAYDPAADYKKMSLAEILVALRRTNLLLDQLKVNSSSLLARKECADILSKLGVTASDIGFAARNVGAVLDGFQATTRYVFNESGQPVSISSIFYGRAPDAAAIYKAWGVWVNPQWAGDASTQDRGILSVLVHELVHNLTGATDQKMLQALFGSNPDAVSSGQISILLVVNCFPK